jgi:prepilin-type N-terminal cleavage/methylation domain-containing protein
VNFRTYSKSRSRRRGMSLVEVLISTTITSLLLTATAGAWKASTNAIDINDKMARSLQAGRIAILQMTNEFRRAQVIDNVHATSTCVPVITFDNHTYNYNYDATKKQLQLIDTSVTPNNVRVLASNVTSCSFGWDMAPNPATQVLCVVHLSITLTIDAGSCPVTLSGSAAPRVNINY